MLRLVNCNVYLLQMHGEKRKQEEGAEKKKKEKSCYSCPDTNMQIGSGRKQEKEGAEKTEKEGAEKTDRMR